MDYSNYMFGFRDYVPAPGLYMEKLDKRDKMVGRLLSTEERKEVMTKLGMCDVCGAGAGDIKEHGDKCPNRTITICGEEYDALIDDSRKLEALQACGVDNWQGYDDAMQLLRSWEEEDD